MDIPVKKKRDPLKQYGCLCCLDYLPLGPNPIPVLQLILYLITILVGLIACIPAGILIVSATLHRIYHECSQLSNRLTFFFRGNSLEVAFFGPKLSGETKRYGLGQNRHAISNFT